jgi:hypothetical protein
LPRDQGSRRCTHDRSADVSASTQDVLSARHLQHASAHLRVGVGDRTTDIADRDAERREPIEIDDHLVLTLESADRRDLGHTWVQVTLACAFALVAMVVACVGCRLRRLDMLDMLGVLGVLGMLLLGRWLRRLCIVGLSDRTAALLLATLFLVATVPFVIAVFAVPLTTARTGGVLRGRVRLVEANPGVCHLAGHRWVAVECARHVDGGTGFGVMGSVRVVRRSLRCAARTSAQSENREDGKPSQ